MSVATLLANVMAFGLPIWLLAEEVAMRRRRILHSRRLAVFLALIITALLGAPAVEAGASTSIRVCDDVRGKSDGARIARFFAKGDVMPISSYDDDPFVADATIDCMDPSRFSLGAGGLPVLVGDYVKIQDEAVIYRANRATGVFEPFAWNPWPPPTSNADGNFEFLQEERFPLFLVERDASGKLVLRDGLQVWTPVDLHRGMTTVFEAANSVRDASESWAGRVVPWGQNGQLEVNAHAFIDFNAFYSPAARQLFFAVLPYRLAGEPIRILEVGTGWEMAAHEAGHAIHHTLKPNGDPGDEGFRTWGESYADQTAMWASLRDPDRARSLLTATNGDLTASNKLSRLGEVFGVLVGDGVPLRDAVNDKKVSDTDDEVHDRSAVLTGAVYRLFVSIVAQGHGNPMRALVEAGEILGVFLTHATDYTPENRMTLEDVGKAYLKVDKEHYDGAYHAILVDELTARELFGADSVRQWLAHEASLPNLRLKDRASFKDVNDLVQDNLDRLGITPGFGLALQSVTRDERFKQTIVRVQLTEGSGRGALPLDNHGILVFRANGRLADYHKPIPDATPPDAGGLISLARRLALDRHGVPLSIVRKPDGRLTVEARVIRGTGINSWMEAFTLDNPRGERREVITPRIPSARGGSRRIDAAIEP